MMINSIVDDIRKWFDTETEIEKEPETSNTGDQMD